MEQLLACALREIADRALRNAILEVGIDSAEGELLSCIVVGLSEGIVLETPVIAVVVEDLYAVLGAECL